MTRYVLFGTLRWISLLEVVAGRTVACTPVTLPGFAVERAAAGDWPVLVPGAGTDALLTEPLDRATVARLDWYETAFDCRPETIEIDGTDARVYRTDDAGSGIAWDLEGWRAAHGGRTRRAAAEVMRAMDRLTPAEVAAMRGVIQARAHAMDLAARDRRTRTVGQEGRASDLRILATDYVYEGFHRVEEWSIDHPRFDGGRSGPIGRVVSNVTDAATVLPWDSVRDCVLVVEQIRMGALAKGDPYPWLLEPVAGLVDAGETPEASALRELTEEAGLVARPEDLHLVSRYYPSPGGLAQILYSYVARCDLPEDAAGLHGLEAEQEDIRTHIVPVDDLIEMVASGEAANAPLVISAQWIALRRAHARAHAH
ncbi:NUDIX domain-containing protein [Jannaschia sp. KMU-145]|uniref:NUDIX domain-containing protein n=1 Tax=Jannaschia halovivens TaxID=3388667 RepID=UPI00396B210E